MSNQVPVVLTNANQSFTDTQKAQGRTDIGAAAPYISCFKDNLTVTDANSLPTTITFSNYQSSAFAMALYQGD